MKPTSDAERESMRARLRQAAVEAEYETGDREPDEESAHRNIVVRIGIILVGSVVLLAGLAMMVLPGPGIVAIILGLGILAQELPWADRLLKTVREKSRVDEVKDKPAWVRYGLIALTVLAIAASFSYFVFIR